MITANNLKREEIAILKDHVETSKHLEVKVGILLDILAKYSNGRKKRNYYRRRLSFKFPPIFILIF